MENNCKDCGRPFVITPEEKALYEKRKMELPKRCRICRRMEVFDNKLKGIRKMLSKILYLIDPNKPSGEQSKPKQHEQRIPEKPIQRNKPEK